MEVVVTGIGLRCCLGTLRLSWQRLLAGESGIKQHSLFEEFPPLPLGMLETKPSQLQDLTKLVVADALNDAGLDTLQPDCGVVIGSSRGCQGAWEALAAQYRKGFPDHEELNSSLSLEHWLEVLPHSGAIAAARFLGSKGPVLAPMAACATGIWAIAQAYELIKTGQCSRVIAGAVETPLTRLTIAGFERMGALAKTGCYPFDTHREGLVLAEGGAVFMLETAELAAQRGASIYGQILGFGLTCDAHHRSAPDETGNIAKAAIQHCLSRSHLSRSDIHYIHAHGTSTTLNDRHEAHLIQSIFGENTPLSSTKGATGHTLGASGALGVAFSLMALKHQILPPCVGLRRSQFDLDLVNVARSHPLEQVLCFSFGFGGQNAIAALGKSPSSFHSPQI